MLRELFVTSVVALFGASALCAPNRPVQLGPPQGQTRTEKEMLERQAKEANKRRQEDIRTDTDKLLQLATELKAAVDKSNEHLLSIDVVRKADEVEHLAHKVKEKMKEAVGPPKGPEPMAIPRPQQ